MKSPVGRGTRPTADQVKEAVFSMLESLPFDFEGAVVADLFAGSGALAFEALSRGAASAVLVDQDKAAADAVLSNIESLGLETGARFIRGRWPRGLERLAGFGPFDLLFLDPPYEERSLPLKLLGDIAAQGLASAGAVAVWEQDPQTLAGWGAAEAEPWEIVKIRRWGGQAAAFLRHRDGEKES